MEELKLNKLKHAAFLRRCLMGLPKGSSSLDTTKITIALFCVSGIDLLNISNEDNSPFKLDKFRDEVIDWIYSLQIIGDGEVQTGAYGFRGGYTESMEFSATGLPPQHWNDCANISQTYSALVSLIVLGDTLDKVNKEAIISSLQKLQQKDGSFCPTMNGGESDMRFTYCATSISYILDSWSGLDINASAEYIGKCQNYDGGFGQSPGNESHGGSTLCAVASLALMGKLEEVLTQEKRVKVVRWCLMRQREGFHGRSNKPDDTCYSFWVGASLSILNALHFSSAADNRRFILSTGDDIIGGFAKYADSQPDPLHTYFGICGLSLLGLEQDGIRQMFVALNMSERAHDHLTKIHKKWKN